MYKQMRPGFINKQGYIHVNSSAVRFNSIHEELKYVIDKLKKAGVSQIIVVNSSPDDKYGLKSVKVIIPKLELIFVSKSRYQPSPFYREKVNRTAELIRHLTT